MEASFDQAAGKLALLKSSFAGSAKTDTAQAAAFTAAATTCDRMVAALDERQQTLSRIQASAAVKGDNDLGRARKDNLAQGINAKGGAKKAAIKGELKRERLQIKEAREEAAIGDDALTAGSVNHWNQRAIELRRQITASYSRISQSGS